MTEKETQQTTEQAVNADTLVSGNVDNYIGVSTTNYPMYKICIKYETIIGIGPNTKVTGVSFDSKGSAMEIEMPCGEIVTFKRFADIPEKTIMCPCGNQNHTVFEYR